MKRITIRELNRKFYRVLGELPVVITVHGEDRYILSRYIVPGIHREAQDSPPKTRKVVQKPIQKPISKPEPVSLPSTMGKSRPKICPKHGGQLIGDRYTCGCR